MAEFTADLYFDDILQPKEDYSDIKKNFNLTIKREESFNGGENILRELSRTTLDVKGCCYTYLCEKFKNNPCGEVKVYIEITIHGEKLTFNGLFRLSSIDWFHKKKIAKIVGIKDNSFSGLIQGYTNVDTKLYNTKTINCEPNKINSILINTPTTPSTYVITDILAFDVLEVFKYIIAYFTDNKITVKSDFLTNTKLAIATGYSMHNSIVTLNDSYPKISFDTIFSEVNKKYPIKKVVEYELDGTPYLRIEEENYTYEDTEILELSTIPLDFECTIDLDRLYNYIQIGSSNTKLEDSGAPLVTGKDIDLWIKDTYANCGGCVGEKKIEVNFVNEFIIDANIIHEAMEIPIGDDYNKDEDIFLLNYFFDGVNNKLVGNNTSMYNENLNNYNTLVRHLGVTNSCLISQRLPTNYFRLYSNINQLLLVNPSGFGGTTCGVNKMTFNDIEDLNNNILSTTKTFSYTCLSYSGVDTFQYFKSPTNGNFTFKGASSFIQDNNPAESSRNNVNYTIRFRVYLDDTFTTEIYPPFEATVNTNDAKNNPKYLELNETITLATGNCVLYEVFTDMDIAPIHTGNAVRFNFSSLFELTDDDTSCEVLQDDLSIFKPFISNFEMPLSACDYNKLKANPKGYININGVKCWISEIDYGITRNTKFIVISKDLIC